MKMPNRRPCITQTVEHGGEKWHVTIGIHPHTGDPIECWAYGPKAGSDLWALAQDTCRLASFQLQEGVDPINMGSKAIRDDSGRPLSLYGLLADILTEHVLDT